MSLILEIATTDFETTRAAIDGGANRIELCANLGEGGTTPSFGTIRQCRKWFSQALYPIIRARGGDFFYSEDEFQLMIQDILLCKQIGCDGIVTGFLTLDGSIDVERTSGAIEIAYPLGVTFHRAFDRCRDPFEALEQLIRIGCERVLTSGQQLTAMEGAPLISELNNIAGGRIVIMPGSGVRKENLASLMKTTGCEEFHASLRSKQKSRMNYIQPAFNRSEESYMNNWIDPAEVTALKKILVDNEADPSK